MGEDFVTVTPNDDSRDVLSQLPKARPSRGSAKRASAAAAPTTPPPPTEEPHGPVDPPSTGEILQSAVNVAVEIAGAGVGVGKHVLTSALSKLPRP